MQNPALIKSRTPGVQRDSSLRFEISLRLTSYDLCILSINLTDSAPLQLALQSCVVHCTAIAAIIPACARMNPAILNYDKTLYLVRLLGVSTLVESIPSLHKLGFHSGNRTSTRLHSRSIRVLEWHDRGMHRHHRLITLCIVMPC